MLKNVNLVFVNIGRFAASKQKSFKKMDLTCNLQI